MKELIENFEKQYDFSIEPFLKDKSGMELITGFFEAFQTYKVELLRLESEYKDFFNCIGHEEIKPDYMQALTGINWFCDIISELRNQFNSILSVDDKKRISSFIVEIVESSCSAIQFTSDENFDIYYKYFLRLKGELGFREESYITFCEYKKNADTIEKLDEEEFKAWVKAQKISGKL